MKGYCEDLKLYISKEPDPAPSPVISKHSIDIVAITLTYVIRTSSTYKGGPPKNRIYLLKIVHLFLDIYTSVTSIWCKTPTETFSCSKQFWTHQFWCLLVLLLFFCFTTSTLIKHFSLRAFSIQGNPQKVTRCEIRWIGRVGHRVILCSWSKLLNTQHSVGRCACKSPTTKWANAFKESWKKFTEATQPLTTPPAGTLMGS